MDVRAFLIDLDGVLYVGGSPIPGARRLLKTLDELGYPYRFVSNSTRRCRSSVAARLHGLGFDIKEDIIFTPPQSAVEYMRRNHLDNCFLITTGDVHKDFQREGLSVVEEGSDIVVVGDAGQDFTYKRLNSAFRQIIDGAGLIALEMDRYWREPDGLVLSAGPFVAALEYATGVRAHLVGKPSHEFFCLGLESMRAIPSETAMIGDDIFTDVAAAQSLGMRGILVRTGKYREDVAASSGILPDLVLGSIADLEEHIAGH